MTLQSADTAVANAGSVTIQTGQGNEATGSIHMSTGSASAGSSGDISFQAGRSSIMQETYMYCDIRYET